MLENFRVVDNHSRQSHGTWPRPGVWTRDIKKTHATANRLKAGNVWINCYNVFDPALPFDGYKQSGWGREMGHEVIELYTEVKFVCAAL